MSFRIGVTMKDIAFQILANENNSTKIAKSIEAVGQLAKKSS